MLLKEENLVGQWQTESDFMSCDIVFPLSQAISGHLYINTNAALLVRYTILIWTSQSGGMALVFLIPSSLLLSCPCFPAPIWVPKRRLQAPVFKSLLWPDWGSNLISPLKGGWNHYTLQVYGDLNTKNRIKWKRITLNLTGINPEMYQKLAHYVTCEVLNGKKKSLRLRTEDDVTPKNFAKLVSTLSQPSRNRPKT